MFYNLTITDFIETNFFVMKLNFLYALKNVLLMLFHMEKFFLYTENDFFNYFVKIIFLCIKKDFYIKKYFLY